MQINVHEAKTQFSKLLTRVMNGEEITISKSGKPVARLVPLVTHATRRKPGTAGERVVLHDDFMSPLSDDIQNAFESTL